MTQSSAEPESLYPEAVDEPLEAADLAAFEAWLQTRAGELSLSVTPSTGTDQTDIYLDTGDWRFFRASYALRLRRTRAAGEVEAQLCRLRELEGGWPSLAPRREVSELLPNGNLETLYAAPGPVGQRLRALVGPADIRPLFAVQTHEKTLLVTREVEPAAAVEMEEARILRGPGLEPVRVQLVKVRMEPSPAGAVEALIEAVLADGVAQPTRRSIYAAGLEALMLRPPPPPDFGPAEINERLSLGELALAVLRRYFVDFVEHEPGTRLGDDPEELHRMRVASRRLRAALSLYAECLPARFARICEDLRWVAASLGEVRDVDVQLEHVEVWQAEADLAEPGVLEPLKRVLEDQRERARAHLLTMLDSRRFARFAGAFAAMLESGLPRRPRFPAARRPAVDAMPALIVDRYREVCQAGDELTKGSPPQAYHTLRIRGKRLRYALEFTAEIYGEPAVELIRNVVALQDLLGLHQDAIVAMAQLRALAETRSRHLPPPTLFAMGEITQQYAHQMVDCRRRFPAVYGRVKGKPWKRLRQALKTLQGPDAPEPG